MREAKKLTTTAAFLEENDAVQGFLNKRSVKGLFSGKNCVHSVN